MKITVAKIKNLSCLRPTLALVLGSGFNHVRRARSDVPYREKSVATPSRLD